jgi:magnesium transporter
MAGTDPAEMETASPARAAAIRLSWLLPCMLGMSITAAVIALSEARLDAAVYAAIIMFVPMVAAMSGNSGIQISTVIVRGLATGDLAGTHVGLALHREGVIALIMAPVCGLLAGFISRLGLPVLQATGVVNTDVRATLVASAVGIGMTVAILIAGSLGIFLPFVFRRIGVDPAIASGPIVTTANDVISVATYLAIAIAIMG